MCGPINSIYHFSAGGTPAIRITKRRIGQATLSGKTWWF